MIHRSAIEFPIALEATGERALRVSAVVAVVVAAVLWMGPIVVRRDLFVGDAAHHVFWFYRFNDPSLFPRDPSVEYFSWRAPWGYFALYAVLARFVDALVIAEVVAVLLLVVSGVLAWHLGKSLGSEHRALAGLFACASMLVLLRLGRLLPALGLQQAFALPITLLCLWALLARRYVWVGVSWLAAALFYPVILPGLGITGCSVMLVELVRARRLPQDWQWNAALGCVSLALVLLGPAVPDGLGPVVTYEQARNMPEFGLHGRSKLFGDTWVKNWFTNGRTGLGWSPLELLPIAVAVLVVVLSGRSALIPGPVWILLLTGVSLWAAARGLLFHLYLPERHFRWSMGAFALVALTAAGLTMLSGMFHRAAPSSRALDGINWVMALAAPLVVLGVLLPPASKVWQSAVDVDLERAYEFLSTLPPDALVAAHPDLADYVPLRARRSVLASTEAGSAGMLGYYAWVRPRLEASLRAAYATSWQALDSVLAPYGVDVVLTGPSMWARQYYYAPYDELVRGLIARGKQEGFVLANPLGNRVLFRSGKVHVVRVMRVKPNP